MAMNLDSATATLQARLQQEPLQPERPRFENQLYKSWLETCATVLDKVNEFAVKIDQIRRDKSRTTQGQGEQLNALAPAALQQVSPLVMKPLRDVTAAMTRLSNVMLAPLTVKPKGDDPTIIFLREQELRRSIRKEDAATAYLQALGADDLETVRSILDAPGAPWLTDDIRRRGEEEYARRTNPQAWAQRESLDYFKDHLTSLVAQVRTWTLALGALPKDVDNALGA